MNSNTPFTKDKNKLILSKKTNVPFIKIPKIFNPFTISNSQRGAKDISYENNFIFKRILNKDVFVDKNNKKSIQNTINSTYRKIDGYINTQNTTKNSMLNKTKNLYLYSSQLKPKSCLTSNRLKILYSGKNNMVNLTQKNIKVPKIKNDINLNYVDINSTNLINLEKIWDELCINKKYRDYFKYIYKELDTDYKEHLYLKETEELNNIKNSIKELKYFINLRKEVLNEIKNLNDKLEQELLEKNNNGKEKILKEICDKINLLREHTIDICHSMQKIKSYMFSINNLDKYNLDLISRKFDFDKNYIIKMKFELNFLREGFAKYYFNIEKDQTPFLLNASDGTKIPKGDLFLRIIPLSDELKKKILDCDFYIHQELIAYQNENFNKQNFRCISPIRKTIDANKEKKFEKFRNNSMCELRGFLTEKGSAKTTINGVWDRAKEEFLDENFNNVSKHRKIGVFTIKNDKRKNTIDKKRNIRSSNIYILNQYNNFYQKNRKNHIRENIKYIKKDEYNKSEPKIKENKKMLNNKFFNSIRFNSYE